MVTEKSRTAGWRRMAPDGAGCDCSFYGVKDDERRHELGKLDSWEELPEPSLEEANIFT